MYEGPCRSCRSPGPETGNLSNAFWKSLHGRMRLVHAVAVGLVAELLSAHGREGLAGEVLNALPGGCECGVHEIQSE